LYRVGLQRKERVHPDTKLAVHAYRSPTRTRGIVFSFIFMAHQSGPYRTVRTPEDPLIHDSLSITGFATGERTGPEEGSARMAVRTEGGDEVEVEVEGIGWMGARGSPGVAKSSHPTHPAQGGVGPALP
jgi:hypothetical protein